MWAEREAEEITTERRLRHRGPPWLQEQTNDPQTKAWPSTPHVCWDQAWCRERLESLSVWALPKCWKVLGTQNEKRDFRIFVFTPLFHQGDQRLESVTVLENSSAQPVSSTERASKASLFDTWFFVLNLKGVQRRPRSKRLPPCWWVLVHISTSFKWKMRRNNRGVRESLLFPRTANMQAHM